MWPILFKIGDFTLYVYPVIHMLAMAGMALFGAWWLRKWGAEAAVAVDAAVAYPYAMSILAHIPYCLLEYGFTAETPGHLVNITEGGLWGGQAILLVGLALYALVRRFPFWAALDLLAPAVLLGLGIGKVACLLGGCCWGVPSGDFFGLTLHPESTYAGCYPRVPLHPLPLYDALWAGLGVVLLLLLAKKRPRPGTVFLVFLFLYAMGRFLTEFLRHSYTGKTAVFGLYASQLVELCAMALAVALLVRLHLVGRKRWVPDNPERLIHDPELPAGVTPAGRVRRVMAFLLDIVPAGAAVALAVAFEGKDRWPMFALAGALYLVVQVFLPRTPGALLLGLEMMDQKGHRVVLWRRFLRALCLPLQLATIVGIFRPLVSSSGQAFHDMAAGVHVVRAERP